MKIFAMSMQDIENKLNAILMKNIKYQLNKTAKTLTDFKTVIPEEYYKFCDVFLKKTLNTFAFHSKYDHQICLLKKYKYHDHNFLSKMSEEKLLFIKNYLKEHLKKKFIDISNIFCSSLIMLAAKPGEDIRFCVNYRKLNAFIKKMLIRYY